MKLSKVFIISLSCFFLFWKPCSQLHRSTLGCVSSEVWLSVKRTLPCGSLLTPLAWPSWHAEHTFFHGGSHSSALYPPLLTRLLSLPREPPTQKPNQEFKFTSLFLLGRDKGGRRQGWRGGAAMGRQTPPNPHTAWAPPPPTLPHVPSTRAGHFALFPGHQSHTPSSSKHVHKSYFSVHGS